MHVHVRKYFHKNGAFMIFSQILQKNIFILFVIEKILVLVINNNISLAEN